MTPCILTHLFPQPSSPEREVERDVFLYRAYLAQVSMFRDSQCPWRWESKEQSSEWEWDTWQAEGILEGGGCWPQAFGLHQGDTGDSVFQGLGIYKPRGGEGQIELTAWLSHHRGSMVWSWMRSSPPRPLSSRPCACLLSTWPATARGKDRGGIVSLFCPLTSQSLGFPSTAQWRAVMDPASKGSGKSECTDALRDSEGLPGCMALGVTEGGPQPDKGGGCTTC